MAQDLIPDDSIDVAAADWASDYDIIATHGKPATSLRIADVTDGTTLVIRTAAGAGADRTHTAVAVGEEFYSVTAIDSTTDCTRVRLFFT